MIVRYGPTNISGLEKELRKLGSFHLPSVREMRAMEILYEEYKKTNKNNGTPIKKILQSLHIPNGQDLGTLNDSRYLEKGMMSMNEILKLSSGGIRYMDYFYSLWLRKYEDLGGAIKNGYMENPAKRDAAKQKAKEYMIESMSDFARTATPHQNIGGIFFEVGGDMHNDGTILTDANAVVGVNVRGNYTSKKGRIVQGKQRITQWWENSVVQGLAFIAAILGIVGFFLFFYK